MKKNNKFFSESFPDSITEHIKNDNTDEEWHLGDKENLIGIFGKQLKTLTSLKREMLEDYILGKILYHGDVEKMQKTTNDITSIINEISGEDISEIDKEKIFDIAQIYFKEKQKREERKNVQEKQQIIKDNAQDNLIRLLNGRKITHQDYQQDQMQKTNAKTESSADPKNKKMSIKEMTIRSVIGYAALTLFIFTIVFLMPHVIIGSLIHHLAISGSLQLVLSVCTSMLAIVLNFGPISRFVINFVKKIFKIDEADKQLCDGHSISRARLLARYFNIKRVNVEVEKNASNRNKIQWLITFVCILCLGVPALFVAHLTLPLLCIVAFMQFSVFIGGLVVAPMVMDATQMKQQKQEVINIVNKIEQKIVVNKQINLENLKTAIMYNLLVDRMSALQNELDILESINRKKITLQAISPTDTHQQDVKRQLSELIGSDRLNNRIGDMINEVKYLTSTIKNINVNAQMQVYAHTLLDGIIAEQYKQLVQASSDKLGCVATTLANFAVANRDDAQDIKDKKNTFNNALLSAFVEGKGEDMYNEAVHKAFKVDGKNILDVKSQEPNEQQQSVPKPIAVSNLKLSNPLSKTNTDQNYIQNKNIKIEKDNWQFLNLKDEKEPITMEDIKIVREVIKKLSKDEYQLLKDVILDKVSHNCDIKKMQEIIKDIKVIKNKIQEENFSVMQRYFYVQQELKNIRQQKEEKQKKQQIIKDNAENNLSRLLSGHKITYQDYQQDQTQKIGKKVDLNADPENKKMSTNEIMARSIIGYAVLMALFFSISFLMPHVVIGLLIHHLAISGGLQWALSICGSIFAVMLSVSPMSNIIIISVKKFFKIDKINEEIVKKHPIQKARFLATRAGINEVNVEIEKNTSTRNKITWMIIFILALVVCAHALLVTHVSLPFLCLVAFVQFSIFIGGIIATPMIMDAVYAKKQKQEVVNIVNKIEKKIKISKETDLGGLKTAIMYNLLVDRVSVLHRELDILENINKSKIALQTDRSMKQDQQDIKKRLGELIRIDRLDYSVGDMTNEIKYLESIIKNINVNQQSQQDALALFSMMTSQQYTQLVQASSDRLGCVATAFADFAIAQRDGAQDTKGKKNTFNNALLSAFIEGKGTDMYNKAVHKAFKVDEKNIPDVKLSPRSIQLDIEEQNIKLNIKNTQSDTKSVKKFFSLCHTTWVY